MTGLGFGPWYIRLGVWKELGRRAVRIGEVREQ